MENRKAEMINHLGFLRREEFFISNITDAIAFWKNNNKVQIL